MTLGRYQTVKWCKTPSWSQWHRKGWKYGWESFGERHCYQVVGGGDLCSGVERDARKRAPEVEGVWKDPRL